VSGPHPGDRNDKKRRRGLSASAAQVINGLIIGVCTLVVGFFGGAYANRTGHVFAQPAVTVTVTPSGRTSTGAPGSAEAASGQMLFGKDNLQLTSGYAVSFNNPGLQPYSDPSPCTDGDLGICDGDLIGSSAQLADYAGRGGFAQCQADTTYVSGPTDFHQSLVGTTLCVTTATRLAACYVTGDTTQSQSAPVQGLAMDCTVYALE
jgi:hypothetical protein